ncbi:hypothetical protein EON67_02385 [archaeon]|nr:MAG: hypothetical protein EON67_02385 [archaeon]
MEGGGEATECRQRDRMQRPACGLCPVCVVPLSPSALAGGRPSLAEARAAASCEAATDGATLWPARKRGDRSVASRDDGCIGMGSCTTVALGDAVASQVV